jgi:hypothetical protein
MGRFEDTAQDTIEVDCAHNKKDKDRDEDTCPFL